MLHATARRSIIVNTLALALLVVVPRLAAQQMDDCDTECHIDASHYYNYLDANSGMTEEELRDAGQEYKDNCTQLNC